ncbi:MAG TPA: molecular chaperone TorD family protein [Candidatus Eisenbacteria bacterium]|nr:molecular chaperone TorD family protein [Candidatus Eisenbacteria bacterium]
MDTPGLEASRESNPEEIALCRATLYAALALGFSAPTDDTVRRFGSETGAATLIKAAAILDEQRASSERLDSDLSGTRLAPAFQALASAAQAGLPALAAAYSALLRHTARGPVPPYETEYGNESLFQQPQALGDLMGFYRAFGLEVDASTHERPDHISCECEFLSFLSLKEVYALERGDLETLERTRNAERLFLRDHLGRFMPAFAARLVREQESGFYRLLADAGLRLVSQECAGFRVRLGESGLALRPSDDERVPIACGDGAECAALPGACGPERDEPT